MENFIFCAVLCKSFPNSFFYKVPLSNYFAIFKDLKGLRAPEDLWRLEILKLVQFKSNTIECFKSSHQRCSMKIGVLRNFTKFKGKQLCQSLLFNKVVSLRLKACNFIKKEHRRFLVNFAKFLRTPFLQNTPWWLLLMLLSENTASVRKCHFLLHIMLNMRLVFRKVFRNLWRKCLTWVLAACFNKIK